MTIKPVGVRSEVEDLSVSRRFVEAGSPEPLLRSRDIGKPARTGELAPTIIWLFKRI